MIVRGGAGATGVKFAKHGVPDMDIAKQASWGATRDNMAFSFSSRSPLRQTVAIDNFIAAAGFKGVELFENKGGSFWSRPKICRDPGIDKSALNRSQTKLMARG